MGESSIGTKVLKELITKQNHTKIIICKDESPFINAPSMPTRENGSKRKQERAQQDREDDF